MTRTRVQTIVIQDDKVLFGYGKGYHFFPGGGLEEEETTGDGALRELREEANVEGKIIFRLSPDVFPDTVTFLVDTDKQTPRLGYDPEETDTGDGISLAGLDLVPLESIDSFTRIDVDYFKLLVAQCRGGHLDFPWLRKMETLIGNWRPK